MHIVISKRKPANCIGIGEGRSTREAAEEVVDCLRMAGIAIPGTLDSDIASETSYDDVGWVYVGVRY